MQVSISVGGLFTKIADVNQYVDEFILIAGVNQYVSESILITGVNQRVGESILIAGVNKRWRGCSLKLPVLISM